MTRLEKLRHDIDIARQTMDRKIANDNCKLEDVYKDSVVLDELIEQYIMESESLT